MRRNTSLRAVALFFLLTAAAGCAAEPSEASAASTDEITEAAPAKLEVYIGVPSELNAAFEELARQYEGQLWTYDRDFVDTRELLDALVAFPLVDEPWLDPSTFAGSSHKSGPDEIVRHLGLTAPGSVDAIRAALEGSVYVLLGKLTPRYGSRPVAFLIDRGRREIVALYR